jgi:hypothetical protein
MIAEQIANLPVGSNQHSEHLTDVRPTTQAGVAEQLGTTPKAISPIRAINTAALRICVK